MPEQKDVDKIARYIKDNSKELIAFISNLISYRTISQDPDNEYFPTEIRKCCSWLTDYLESMGSSIDTWLAHPMTFEEHPVIVGTLKGAAKGKSIALNGHIDVVPVGDPESWKHDPWSGDVAEGKIWGRGISDMKGGVAAMIQAVRVLQECGYRLKGDVFFHIVSDEEVVGFGSRECTEKAPLPDFMVVTEPTNVDVIPVEGGLEHLRIEIEGIEEHAGKRYSQIYPQGKDKGHGVNAIEKGMKIALALQDLEKHWALSKSHPLLPPGFNTIMPGYWIGGWGGGKDGKLNFVANAGTTPNYCCIEYNIWYLPQESLEDIKKEIEDFLLSHCKHDPWLREHPPKLTWGVRNISFPPFNTDPEHEAIKMLTDSLKSIGCSPDIHGATYASDLSWYSIKGVAGVIFGPGDIAQAHSVNEFITVENYLNTISALALLILQWCGYE